LNDRDAADAEICDKAPFRHQSAGKRPQLRNEEASVALLGLLVIGAVKRIPGGPAKDEGGLDAIPDA
jgi:hypothetical protein